MSKKSISIKFGEKVREFRASQNLSQEQLAHLADVHRTYIGMIERAEKNITLVNIEKIAKALNCLYPPCLLIAQLFIFALLPPFFLGAVTCWALFSVFRVKFIQVFACHFVLACELFLFF